MIRINLLPEEHRERKRRDFKLDKTRMIPVAALAVVLVACTITAMVQGSRVKSLEQNVAEARAETEQYKRTIALINEMVRKEAEINRRLSLIEQLDHDRFRAVQVMDEMARRVPRYMWLTSMREVSKDRMSFEGLAFSNLVVSDLMNSLETSDLFEDVELTIVRRTERDGQNVVNFTVTSAVHAKKPDESQS